MIKWLDIESKDTEQIKRWCDEGEDDEEGERGMERR